MTNIVRIKRRVSGGAGAPSSLKTGELAWNMVDNIVYGGFGDDGSGGATSIKLIGGTGITRDQFAAPAANTSWNSKKITNLADPTSAQDAMTKAYADANYASAYSGGTGITITGSSIAIDTSVVARISVTRLDQLAAPTSDVAWNAHKITGLADPTGAQDAATKNYVDSKAQGLSPKMAVQWATTAALAANTYANGTSGVGATLTGNSNGALSVDGNSPAVNDRVLVMNEGTASHNGIYVVTTAGDGSHAYVLTRDTDADTSAKLLGAYTFVEGGTTNAASGFTLASTSAITLGTTAINFTQFSGAGEITAGTSLTKSGNTLSINTSWVGQTAITTLGTISTGTWQGTIIGMAYGGAGADMTAIANGSLLKKTAGGFAAAVLDTDYSGPSSTIDGGTF